jgi:DNA-binding CsgD family transcriptional regulator
MPTPVRRADRLRRLARAGLGHLAFENAVDEELRPSIGYDFAAWGTVDPATLLVTSCTPIGDDPFGPDHERRTFEIEYLRNEPLTLRSFVASDRTVGSLRTEFDDVRASLRYRELLAPAGVFDELIAIFTVDGHCWGCVRAFRHDDARPFEAPDLDEFAAVAPTVAEGQRLAFLRAATENGAAVDDPPGLVTLAGDGRISTCNSAGRAWLETLATETDIRVVLASLAAQAHVEDAASAVVVGTRGALALHASRLTEVGELAVIIERPRPVQLAPRIMVAYDLTPRESQIVELVLRGQTTVQIARSLDISRYTVQDHLKSIFAKVGVQTRGELANEIYVRFYLPPKDAGVTPGPYGYFLGL